MTEGTTTTTKTPVAAVVVVRRRKARKPQGFATMSHEKVVAIASLGGKSAHAQGVAHKWTSETAPAAGRKGGLRSRRGPTKAKAQEEETETETISKPEQG